MAFRREGSSTQFAAVELVEVQGEARYELAGRMIQLSHQVSQACVDCPIDHVTLLSELWAGCQQVEFLCDDWRNWFEQTQEMPLEFCTPEPNLFPLAEVPVSRLGVVPPHVTRVRNAIDTLKELVTMQVFYTNTTLFFQNLDYLNLLASACRSFGDLLGWPVMKSFSTELSELARKRRLETISFSPDMIEGFVG